MYVCVGVCVDEHVCMCLDQHASADEQRQDREEIRISGMLGVVMMLTWAEGWLHST